VTPPMSMHKPHLQLLWALGLAVFAVVVAWFYGDPSWGLVVGGLVLVGYAATSRVGPDGTEWSEPVRSRSLPKIPHPGTDASPPAPWSIVSLRAGESAYTSRPVAGPPFHPKRVVDRRAAGR
jgi:hypothetical protein